MSTIWEETCRAAELISKTGEFKRKVDAARRIAWEGHSKGKLYGSLSGGKDSTALAGLLVESGIDVQWCHAHSSLNLPDTLKTTEAVADKLDLAFDIIEPEQDALEALSMLPKEKSIFESARGFLGRFTSGALLIQYGYEGEWDGHFDGVRAEESRQRKIMLYQYGPVYQSKLDRKWTCRPLAWWSAMDVLAFCVSRDLPIHPYYELCVNAYNVPLNTIRIDWLFAVNDGINARGACAPIKRFYPGVWNRIASMRPELAAYD